MPPAPDPRIEQDREAWLDHLADLEEPFHPEEWWDPDGPPPPGEDRLTPEELAGVGLAAALGESRGRADGRLAFAWQLETWLPGTRVALQDGTIGRSKAEIRVEMQHALLDLAQFAAVPVFEPDGLADSERLAVQLEDALSAIVLDHVIISDGDHALAYLIARGLTTLAPPVLAQQCRCLRSTLMPRTFCADRIPVAIVDQAGLDAHHPMPGD